MAVGIGGGGGRWGRAAALAASLAAARGALADGGGCERGRLDRRTTASGACLRCHDGTGGPTIGSRRTARGHATSHPVDLDYAGVASAHPDAFQPAATLPPEVPLVGGKIACTTCHGGPGPDGTSRVSWRALCLACHRL